MSGDMGDSVNEALRVAVNLARNENIRTVAQLRMRIHQIGSYSDQTVADALKYWANHEARRRNRETS